MKTLKEIVKSGGDDIKIDPTLTECYGVSPLFPHKIERIKALVKGTVLDPNAKLNKAGQESTSTPI